MTEAEKQEIVGLVMTQISSQAVDFDIATEEPKANDLLTAVRETESGGYRGVTIKWDDVARIATELANQAAKRAEDAKTSIVASKEYAEKLNADTTEKVETFEESFASTISDIKAKIQDETTERKNADSSLKDEIAAERSRIDSFTSLKEGSTTGDAELIDARVGYNGTTYDNVGTAIRTQISEEKNKRVEEIDGIKNRILPIDFRVTDPNMVILDVNVTGTMEAFVNGMEQGPNEAIALTLEPVVPTAGSHNFGVRGQICIDGNYLYVCIADNEWKKIPLQEL